MPTSSIPNSAAINIGMLLTAIIIILGFILKYRIKRRAFYRRNSAGLETFDNYEKAVSTRIFEGLGSFLSIFMIVAGLFVLAFLWWLKKQ